MSVKSKFAGNREEFYQDLADAFEASESLYTFLSRRKEFCVEQGWDAQADLYEDMRSRIGLPLVEIIGDVAPDEDAMSLTTVDQADGDLERARMLRDLAASIKRRRGMNKILWKSLSGPAIALPVVILLPLLVSFQMPLYEELLPHSEWGFFGEAFYWICYVLRTFWYLLAGAGIAAAFWMVQSFRNWRGPLRARLDNHLPYSIYRDVAAAGFLTAMAEYMGNKTPVMAALEELKERATPWMAGHIEETLERLEEKPGDYAYAFDTGLLAPELHLRLVAYAERGNARVSNSNGVFAQGLIQLGTDGLQHVSDRIEKNAVWLSFASTLATIAVLLVFYGGFTAVGGIVADRATEDAEQTSVKAAAK